MLCFPTVETCWTHNSCRFVQGNPDTIVNSLESLKDFERHVAFTIDGMKLHGDNDDEEDEGDAHVPGGLKSVRDYWHNL